MNEKPRPDPVSKPVSTTASGPELEDTLKRLEYELKQQELKKKKLEIKALSPSATRKLVDVSKSFLTLLIGIGGVVAGVNGYQLAEKKKIEAFLKRDKALDQLEQANTDTKLANESRNIAKIELEDLNRKIVKLGQDLFHLKESKAKAKEETDTANAKAATAKAEADGLGDILNEKLARLEAELLAKASDPIPIAEIELADSQKDGTKVPDPFKTEVDGFVSYLFSNSGNERVKGYDALTSDDKLRTSTYAVEEILRRGREQIEKPDSFVGLYHTIVTLTGMSRAVTKNNKELREKILRYAADVQKAQPRLDNRIGTLEKWILPRP